MNRGGFGRTAAGTVSLMIASLEVCSIQDADHEASARPGAVTCDTGARLAALEPKFIMLIWMLVSFVLIALAAFAVQRTSHRAEKPRKWIRNGLLGIGTISTAVMALLIGLRNPNAFAILA